MTYASFRVIIIKHDEFLCGQTRIKHNPFNHFASMGSSKSSSASLDRVYRNIRQVIDEARVTVYRAANSATVQAYWNIGRIIVEQEQRGERRAGYGEQLIGALASRLTKEYGKGFTTTNLKYMRQFYSTFGISHALRDQLSWTHYRLLLRVDREDARLFYMNEAAEGNWSTRTLERQIDSLYFERMALSATNARSMSKPQVKPPEEMQARELIRDPYVLEFLDIKSDSGFYEKELEQAIIDKLQEFLLELGTGFSFVGRQYRVQTELQDFYIDLVFYNFILKCFMLIDLKTGKLTHQDIGQMDMYVRLFEDKVRQKSDNPTIGLILCSEKDKTIVKYSLLSDSKQIFASRYKTVLPTEKRLRQEIERERHLAESELRLIR